MLNICPFDHLPRKIKKTKGNYVYDIQVFFQDVEFLESVHQHLEKQAEEMERLLNTSTCGKVTNVDIGVVT